MKKQILTLVIGIFIGAIITTGVFLVLKGNTAKPSNGFNRGERPAMNGDFKNGDFPSGDFQNVDFQNGERPSKNGNFPGESKDFTKTNDNANEQGNSNTNNTEE